MHFDEVYHARTAMEFLQDWRYGMPHSIYEYTHPTWPSTAWRSASRLLGNNQVTSTAQLTARRRPTRRSSNAGARPTNQYAHSATGCTSPRALQLTSSIWSNPDPRGRVTSGCRTSRSRSIQTRTRSIWARRTARSLRSPRRLRRYSRWGPQSKTWVSRRRRSATMSDLDGQLVRLAVIGSHLVGLSSGGHARQHRSPDGRRNGPRDGFRSRRLHQCTVTRRGHGRPGRRSLIAAARPTQLAPILKDDADAHRAGHRGGHRPRSRRRLHRLRRKTRSRRRSTTATCPASASSMARPSPSLSRTA